MKVRKTVVIVECVGCKDRKEIKPGEVASYDQPMCSRCFMPMVPVKAVSK